MVAKNEPIGEVECPAKNCTDVVPLFKFRGRPNETMRRRAGKLYCRCPKHGQFGGESDPEMQEYLLENATIWGDKKPAGEKPADASAEPVKLPEIPQKLPATPAARKAPAAPAIKTPAAPAAEPAAPAQKRTGFGFFT